MPKILKFAAPKTCWALKQLSEYDIYFKVTTGSYVIPTLGKNEGSVWNSRSAAEVWINDATRRFGGTWGAVRVDVSATTHPYEAKPPKVHE